MENQPHIAATPDTARLSPAPVSTAARVSLTTDRFPAWMVRHQTWIISVVSVIALLTLLCLGWAASTVQDRLVQSAGHSLVQAATDAASKLDMMIHPAALHCSDNTWSEPRDADTTSPRTGAGPPSLSVDRRHRLTREDHRGHRYVHYLPRSEPESLVPTGTYHHWRQDSGCAGE